MAYGSNFVQNIYNISPFFVKNLFTTLYGYKTARQRHGKLYFEWLDFIHDSQYWNNSRVLEYSSRRLEKFIIYAIENIEYYREREVYGEYCNNKKLSYLPLLSKNDVKENLSKFYHPNLNEKKFMWMQTSGSTGSPLKFPIDNSAFQKEQAFRELHRSWGGLALNNKNKIAVCSGHPVKEVNDNVPPFWSYDYYNKWLIFSSYHLNYENLKFYIKELEKYSPDLLWGYPSSIYLLANAYKKYGKKKLKLKSVITASETLLDFQKTVIEEAFNTNLLIWYGNSEYCGHIVQCEKGELHVKHEHSYVEILNNENEPCKNGETGRIVATSFSNKLFPLIRYDTGDFVTVSKDQNSKCGRGGFLIDSIEGRKEDYIFTPEGKIVGRLDHLFKDALNVKLAQIIQHKLDEIILRLSVKKNYSKSDENKIMEEARKRLGNQIKIYFEYVDDIQKNKNGKYKFVISTLDQSEMLKSLIN